MKNRYRISSLCKQLEQVSSRLLDNSLHPPLSPPAPFKVFQIFQHHILAWLIEQYEIILIQKRLLQVKFSITPLVIYHIPITLLLHCHFSFNKNLDKPHIMTQCRIIPIKFPVTSITCCLHPCTYFWVCCQQSSNPCILGAT